MADGLVAAIEFSVDLTEAHDAAVKAYRAELDSRNRSVAALLETMDVEGELGAGESAIVRTDGRDFVVLFRRDTDNDCIVIRSITDAPVIS